MDRERSHRKDKTLSDWEHNERFISREQIKDIQKPMSISITERHLTDHRSKHQITSFKTDFWSWSRQSYWFYFGHGLFWGLVIGFTAIFSASCGVALTKIDAVEEAIVQTIKRNSPSQKTSSAHNLTRSVNILLLEVEPSNDEIVKSSQPLVGKNKSTLLLQFDPQFNTAKIINIPEDSRVKIPGFGWGTIADANKYGGTSLVSQMVVQLLDDVEIDRYIRATPKTFDQMIASGKITLNNCHYSTEECDRPSAQISRQQAVVETIRQRLNIPVYFKAFKNTLTKTQSNLDTNLSLPEAMSIANFVKELESDNITVNLVSGYTAGQTININNQLNKSQPASLKPTLVKPLERNINQSSNSLSSLKEYPIAVQNTTDSPELGMRFVSYLRRRNFQDVYLVEHIPLKLNKTKIVINQTQLARAKHLKNILGLGSLEPNFNTDNTEKKPLTVQIGEDAHHLPLNNSTY